MAEITKAAHRFGILVVWDLSHSIGIVPLDMHACDVDFAVGCTYKYLNGGPGAPSFVYENRKHHEAALSPIYGWMGHATPLAFAHADAYAISRALIARGVICDYREPGLIRFSVNPLYVSQEDMAR